MAALIEPLEARLLWSAALSGSFAGQFPVALSPFKANHVAIRVINTGDQATTGRVNVNLYASPTPAPDGSQTLLATSQRALRLRPGKALNVPLRFNSPGVSDGNYYLLAEVGTDADASAPITIASPTAVQIRQPSIDLTAQFSSFPIGPVDVNNGTEDLLAVRVMNRGNVSAVGPLAVSFYASTDATPDPSDTLIGVAARNVRLRPGGSQEFAAAITFPAGFALGNYYVFAQVDSAQAFAESNEANNTVAAPHQLIAANLPAPTIVDQRDQRHHHHHEIVVVDSGEFVGGGIFFGDVSDGSDVSGDPFAPDNSPSPDPGMDQPPPDSSPPDTQPVDDSGGWDAGSSSGSDF